MKEEEERERKKKEREKPPNLKQKLTNNDVNTIRVEVVGLELDLDWKVLRTVLVFVQSSYFF